ncbi:MAG TPA: hypothetical protein VLL97_14405 [Acidobacteriota bacterium]|nr:hypothetical protein [Acidobacteriota bacterium]
MKSITVEGHSRKVGKTSLVTNLIAALPCCSWTALKISSHWHAGISDTGRCAVYEERRRDGATDSSRYLVAGAARSFWIRVAENDMHAVMPQLASILRGCSHVLFESDRIHRYLKADLRLMVVNYGVNDFKESARDAIGSVDALVVVKSGAAVPSWMQDFGQVIDRHTCFFTNDPQVLPAGLIDFVICRIHGRPGSARDRAGAPEGI